MPDIETVAITLSVRQLVEFLLRSGSIDNRFTGFDRALEGARLHRKLQRAALKEHPDYQAEVALKQNFTCAGVGYTIEGRADGIFTALDGTTVIEEIKTTALSEERLLERQPPEHWAQGQVYALIYAMQNGLPRIRVQLTYYQIDTEEIFRFENDYTAEELADIVQQLLTEYAPWAKRAARWRLESRASMRAASFPFDAFRPGQRAMVREVYRVCTEGGQLLCQAPTGIGKTMSVLFPAIKALGSGPNSPDGPVFYLTARGTTRAAAENALTVLRSHNSNLLLRSITLTAKDKICLCESRECTPEACPYANGYFSRIKTALWDALDAHSFTAETLQAYARKHTVCPFEMGLDLSLWSDVIIGDYNYLFDPVVSLKRFFEGRGQYLFLVDEAHNLPGRARDMHSAMLEKSAFLEAKRLLGKPKSSLKNALTRVNDRFIEWRHKAEETGEKVIFQKDRDDAFDAALQRLCDPLEKWLDEHREPNEIHGVLLQLYFDVRGWLRVAETFDDHFVLQISVYGHEVRLTQLCLDPGAFLGQDFSKGHAAVLFSATLAPAAYYKDLCGLPDARPVALRSPFPRENLGLYCLGHLSTRYKHREESIAPISDALFAMIQAHTGNYLAFFPSYAYLEQVYTHFIEMHPEVAVLKQETSMDESQRADFLAKFEASPASSLLGFAVLGGVFGEGVDLAGDRLVGTAVIGPGLPQVNPQQEQLRDYFEETRGSGFDYAYRFPGMNKALQAAGRVIRTPTDKGVVLLIDDRFTAGEYRRLMPPHWAGMQTVYSNAQLQEALRLFWQTP